MTLVKAAFCALFALGLATRPGHAAEPVASPETSTEAVQECVAAHQRARLLELEESWLPAREAMTRCAESSCPIAIQSDCAAWLTRLAGTLPSVLVVVERDDDGTRPVQLELDGKSLELPEPPGPIEMLPGAHRLRFTLPPHAPVEVALVLEKGEKNRVVRVRFTAPRPEPLPAAPEAPRAFVARTRPVPAATYWLSGGALLSALASGGLLASALVSRADARENCAPGCPAAERESIQARLLAADLLAGTSVVLGGLAVYTYVRRPVELKVWSSSSLQLAAEPTATGLKLHGAF